MSPKVGFAAFVGFFKGYMGAAPVAAAAIAPLTTALRALPMFKVDVAEMATISGILAFLVLALAFSTRHAFARVTFITPTKGHLENRKWLYSYVAMRIVVNLMPWICVALSVCCFFLYTSGLDEAVLIAQDDHFQWHNDLPAMARSTRHQMAQQAGEHMGSQKPRSSPIPTRTQVLDDPDYVPPFDASLRLQYLGFFIFAELGFVLMALREYTQQELGFSDSDLIKTPFRVLLLGGKPPSVSGCS